MDLPLRDPVSSLTHLGAAAFALYVTLLLWKLARGDRAKQISLAIFGACAVILYTVSGVYHAIPLPKSSPSVLLFRRFDHSAIYLLIAGTYTPIFAVLLRGRWRAALLATVWLIAAAGVTAKWLYPISGERLAVALYLAMGWIGVVPALALARAVGWRGVGWIAAGGASYTAGAAFELLHWPVLVPGVVGWHEVFHVFTMGGTALHVVFMIRYVVPYRPENLPQRHGGTTRLNTNRPRVAVSL